MTPDEIARMPLDEVIMSLSVRSDVLSRDALHYLRAAEARGYEKAREQAAHRLNVLAADAVEEQRPHCKPIAYALRVAAEQILAMEPEG